MKNRSSEKINSEFLDLFAQLRQEMAQVESIKEDILVLYERYLRAKAIYYYKVQPFEPKLDYGDIYQACYLGLEDALRSFDPTRGVRFITYLTMHINKRAMIAINRNRLIAKPLNFGQQSKKIHQVINKLTVKHGYTPSIEQISKASGFTTGLVRAALVSDPISLSILMQSDNPEGDTLLEILELTHESIDEVIVRQERAQIISASFNALNHAEKQVIVLYFGLCGHEPLSLAKVGKIMGFPRERARQIYNKAIHKIREELSASRNIFINP